MARRFVTGPRSAKLVAWGLGIVFFQGGTVSTVLVGTTVKPLADDQKVSHEELSYIVDSTASPIASQLAFNAWPGYIQAFIYVSGVSFLATEADRILFFFKSVPFCFYAIFAVLGTFLLSIERPLFLGKRMMAAIDRSRSTGELDHPDSHPLSAAELQSAHVPAGYRPHLVDFVLPLVLLIGIAIGTFIAFGSPNVLWAFGVALLAAAFLALGKGMALKDLMDGITDGMKGVVGGSVILLLAITIGGVSKEAGGGAYLVHMLSDSVPFWLLPVMLQVLTIIIAFFDRYELGHVCRGFPVGDASGVGGRRCEWSGASRVLHDDLLCSGDGWKCVRRSVFAHFGYDRVEFHFDGLRSDGPRENADPPGGLCGGSCCSVLDIDRASIGLNPMSVRVRPSLATFALASVGLVSDQECCPKIRTPSVRGRRPLTPSSFVLSVEDKRRG